MTEGRKSDSNNPPPQSFASKKKTIAIILFVAISLLIGARQLWSSRRNAFLRVTSSTSVREKTIGSKEEEEGEGTTITTWFDDGGNRSSYPRFILGHSTGHAGSTSVQKAMKKPGCPWDSNMVAKFENTNRKGFRKWSHGNSSTGSWSRSCDVTASEVLPYLLNYVKNKRQQRGGDGDIDDVTYIDLGHFHNRGRVIECLADRLGGRLALVRIRRNRYDVARSFSAKFRTPCLKRVNSRNQSHPGLSLCPRSGEDIGPVDLPVDDDAWDGMTPFQRFLWYADEMEHRWHSLKKAHPKATATSATASAANDGDGRRPEFYEITWSDSGQLASETNRLREALGCEPVALKHAKKHVAHEPGALNCSDLVRQDLEYRHRTMGYDAETMDVLVSPRLPQRVDGEECADTREELEGTIRRFFEALSPEEEDGGDGNDAAASASFARYYDDRAWVLPASVDDSPNK